MFKTLVHEGQVSEFEARIASASKIVRKLGLSEVLATRKETVLVKIGEEPDVHFVRKYVYEVWMPALQFSGWTFAAALEQTEEGNIVRSVMPVPERFRGDYCECEHCGIKRYRKNVFVVHNEEAGQFLGVGSSCIRDFLGHDISVSGLSEMFSLEENLYEYEESSATGSSEKLYSIDSVLKFAHVIVNKYGYRKSGEEICTKSMIADMFNKTTNSDVNRWKSEIWTAANEIGEEFIPDFKEFVAGMNSQTDYGYNIQTLLKNTAVSGKSFGYLGSAVAVFLRTTAEKQEKKESVHISAVGNKVSVKVTLINKKVFDGQWGAKTFLVMEDESGNNILWKATGWFTTEIGDKFTVTGKVKSLNEYNGIKQTELTRCKIS